MEKAVIVCIDGSKVYRKTKLAKEEALAELNEHLNNGWRIKEMQPTSGANVAHSFCLVILTKVG